MAGIGPFSIPMGKNSGALVLANDLNPASHEFLVGNIKTNRVDGNVRPYNLDAREFIKNVGLVDLNDEVIMGEMGVKRSNAREAKIKNMKKKVPSPAYALDNYVKEKGVMRTFDHYIMNLPGTATEFLGIFIFTLIYRRCVQGTLFTT
jgi:tRNA (guanine37-N1)-methyltransferase